MPCPEKSNAALAAMAPTTAKSGPGRRGASLRKTRTSREVDPEFLAGTEKVQYWKGDAGWRENSAGPGRRDGARRGDFASATRARPVEYPSRTTAVHGVVRCNEALACLAVETAGLVRFTRGSGASIRVTDAASCATKEEYRFGADGYSVTRWTRCRSQGC